MLWCSTRPERERVKKMAGVMATFLFAGVGLPGDLELSAGSLGTVSCW
jgi:hypothetical protein